jgi:type IV secretory pathway VirJ component
MTARDSHPHAKRAWSERRGRGGWFGVAPCLLGLAACTPEPRREVLEHGRFPNLQLVVPDSPRAVALLLAGPAELSRAEALTATLSKRGAIVSVVDAEAFKRVLDATPSGCVFPSGDLDNLAHFVQAYLALPSYQPAILVGLGTGAGLAAGALTQAPPGTFAGAVVFDYCGDPPLRVPMCAADGGGQQTHAPSAPADPLLRLRSDGKACPTGAPVAYGVPAEHASAFPKAFTTLAALASARATSSPSDLSDLPINEVAAQGPGHADIFGVLLSGDGGWAGIDKQVSERLARAGVPIVGIDSLRYFWRARTPEGTAADLDRVIERYQNVWNRPRVVLIGYSQGADVLPFLQNRLSAKTRGAIVSAVALSLSTTATFEFHVRNWVGAPGELPTLPEVRRLPPHALVCVYGKDDPDALCPQLDPTAFDVLGLPGDHHFNGDYDRLSSIVLDSLPLE